MLKFTYYLVFLLAFFLLIIPDSFAFIYNILDVHAKHDKYEINYFHIYMLITCYFQKRIFVFIDKFKLKLKRSPTLEKLFHILRYKQRSYLSLHFSSLVIIPRLNASTRPGESEFIRNAETRRPRKFNICLTMK